MAFAFICHITFFCLVATNLATCLTISHTGRYRIAFSAVRTAAFATGDSDATIVYNNVYTNDGRGFDEHSAHFVAPVSGTYYLAFAIRGSPTVVGDMMHNGKLVARIFAKDYNEGANQVVRRLEAGDNVWVRQKDNYASSGGRYATFSGMLLYAA